MSYIVAPVDGSVLSLKAVEAAADISCRLGATLVILNVADVAKAAAMTAGNAQFVGGCLEALRDEGESIVQRAADHVRSRVSSVETRLVQGNPVEEILKASDQLNAEWIVMGSHGRTGLMRGLLGSVAEGVVRHANVPVMIVPLKSRLQLAAS
jgi:nucleotide-binding universal stress UspA family protein